MKSNFTTAGPLEQFFRPLDGKIHLTPMLVCAVIIITPKSPIPIYSNVNNCCKWDIISFSWTFSSKIPVCAKILQWMVLLPLLGLTLNAWFTTNGMWAKNCTQYKWCELAIIEWSWVWSLLLLAAILWALCACSGSPVAAVASVWIANRLVSPLLSARNPRC